MSDRMIVYAYVSDIDRLRQFYEGALGAKPTIQDANWTAFELGGATFALHRQRSTEPPQDVGEFHFEFQVDDIDVALARFQSQGAQVARGVTDETYGRSAVLRDPDGREFRLVQVEPPH